jgi:sulfatase modifying factor 1
MSIPPRRPLTRRDFLKLTGIAVSAACLHSCTGSTQAFTEAATTSASQTQTNAPSPTGTPTRQPVQALFPTMVLVEPGEFLMGSDDGYANERPVHPVAITRSFSIAMYEVTFEEYDLFCEDTMRTWLDDRGWGRGNQPVIHADWNDAVAYCNWLSEKASYTPCYNGKGKLTECDFSVDGYRLPTEAEWEYAARGGANRQGFIYAGADNPDEVAWYADNSNGQPQPVGTKLANKLDLYDMCGNIFEWCWDWYKEDYYMDSPDSDPLGPPPPQDPKPWELIRARRGGSWREDAVNIRCSVRSFDGIDYAGDNGFRLARTI